jgi:hypothetical protein
VVFASPKSSTLTTPSGVTLMLAGFRSRWTMPFSCAASRASAIWPAMARPWSKDNARAGCPGGLEPDRRDLGRDGDSISASVSPGTSSITSAWIRRGPEGVDRSASSSPWICAMCG